jgi:hypothetical protein
MIVAEIEYHLTSQVFPQWEHDLGEPLTDKLKHVVRVLTVVAIETQVPAPRTGGRGRRAHDRRLLARAFVVKALYNLPTTRHLLEMLHTQPLLRRLCGWQARSDLPSEPTFSRAFAGFALMNLGEQVHAALVQTYIGQRLLGHICRDSTEIDAREKPANKPKPDPKPKRARGRPKRGQAPPAPEPTRLQRQLGQSLQEALTDLPIACDVGCKTDTNGHKHAWVGYKTHIDTADGGLPVTVITTSASLHDSQAAIPMMRRTAERVTSLYDLMDSAYDAAPIYAVSEQLGHKPIIDKNRRGKQVPPLTRRRSDAISSAPCLSGSMPA